MIETTQDPISPGIIINKVKTNSSGCVVSYIGLIRDHSRGKPVHSVEYQDVEGTAQKRLHQIADELRQKWQMNGLAICHRTGKLQPGDINLVIAIAITHRQDGFAACQYAIDQFKQKLPTRMRETYQDGSTWVEGE